MTDPIELLKSKDTSDRQKALNKESSYSVLSVNDALPFYANHNLFDNFMENSLKCQDAIIEKFYKHLLNKDNYLSTRVQNNNSLNEKIINAILDLTKTSNVKHFSFLISLLNNINDFLLGNKNEFGYTTTKFLKNNVDYNLLRRFITQDQEEQGENFAKYVYKHLFGFNLSFNEADFYLDTKNNKFSEINNTTALCTLINLINVYFTSGLVHSRTHSRNKFLAIETNNDRKESTIAKKFFRDSRYANICLDYSFLYKNKINEREFLNYFKNTDTARNNDYYLKNNESFNDPASNYFVTKNTSNFNVFKNIGNFDNNDDYIRLDDGNESLLAASRTKELINLDIAFENIKPEYQNLIKPLISSNVNAALSSEFNSKNLNTTTTRSITKSSYYLANKYLYGVENPNPTLFIENLKYNIGQAKSEYTKFINRQNPDIILDSFFEKTAIIGTAPVKELKSAVVLSNSMPDSLLTRESVNEKDKLFSDNNIDYFESNNKISSLEKGFNKLNLLNVENLDNVIDLHQKQKEKLEEKINNLFEDNKASSCQFYEKILEKSVEGIRNSLERIQPEDQPYIEYYPAHLLEEISLLIRFNSNKNSKGKSLCNLSSTRQNIIKLLFAAAKSDSNIDVLDNFTSDVVERNLNQIKNTEGYNVGKFHDKGTNVTKFINNKSTTYLGFNQAGEAEGDTASIADNAIRSIGISSLSNFVRDMCFYDGTSEVDFSKIPIDSNKKYTLSNGAKISALRYHQSLGHVFSSFYTSCRTSFSAKQREPSPEEGPLFKRYELLNKRGEFFYVPFFGFLRGEYNDYEDPYLKGFLSAENPFDIYTLQASSIFSQMRSSSPRQGIFNSFINLLKDLFSHLDAQSLEYNRNIEFMIFNLFKAYSQIVIMQLSNLFEYSSLLHIPKMVSESPLHYSYGLWNEDKNNRTKIQNNLWSGYKERRRNLDGFDSAGGGRKGADYRYPSNTNVGSNDKLIISNRKRDFQPSQGNIERYLSARGIKGYYSSNQTYNDSRQNFNNFYQALSEDGVTLTFGLFCKKVNVAINTLEKSIDGGLGGENANGNEWFESLKQEASSYKLLGNRTNSFWGTSMYPYNYPLLSSHNHLLSFYDGFIGSSINVLLSQIKENYLVNKTEIFERDAIYGPLSKVHNAFLAEDLSFTFLLDSVRYGFNHFKEYKLFLESLEGDNTELQEKRQLIEENISKFYTSEEGFILDEYLASISKTQKVSIINKFRVDNFERNKYYNKLVNNQKPSINDSKIIKNYKLFKNKIKEYEYDKILVIGVGEDLLERSDGTIYINVYMKDFVYKKRSLLMQQFKYNVSDFGRVRILDAEKYQDSISNESFNNENNILSEQCKDYLAIATGNSLSDSDLFKNSNIELFKKFEGAHYSQETNDLLNQNLTEINSFYEDLNNLKDNISSNEENFFFIQDNFDYSNETDLYLYEKSAKDKIKKDVVKRLALFDYMIFSNDVVGRRCLLREFPRIFYLPINTKKFYSENERNNLRLKNLSDISVEITLEQ